MEFQEVVRRRRMVRNFTTQPVARESVERILRNALQAPSAGFSQGWAFLVFEGAADVAAFWDASFPPHIRDSYRREGVFNAPVVIVPLASKDTYLDRYAEPDKGWTDRDEAHWPIPYWYVDTGMAALLMLQTVVDEGLGALFFGVIEPWRITEAYDVPDTHVPIGGIAIGHRAPDRPSPSLQRGRRGLDAVVHRGRWGVPWGE